jgi:hypothetical protein
LKVLEDYDGVERVGEVISATTMVSQHAPDFQPCECMLDPCSSPAV